MSEPDDDTPPERPSAVLPEHRDYIVTLSDAAVQLTHAAQLLGDVIHELRVTRDPIGAGTREKIGRYGLALRGVGEGITTAFAPQLLSGRGK